LEKPIVNLETDRRRDPRAEARLPSGLNPDWVFDRDLTCPQCRYNLRMLRNPRCPECGTIFRWQALLHVGCPRCGEGLYTEDGDECPRCKLPLNWDRLLSDSDPKRIRQFEYTQRPIRAAFAAWTAALLPARFWKSIPLESPPAVRRLRWLRRFSLVICAVGIFTPALLGASGWILFHSAWTVPLAAIALTLPLVTAISLPRFTPTLGRFRIRSDQVLRCLAYACACWFWLGLASLLMTVVTLAGGPLVRGSGRPTWGTLYSFDLNEFLYFVLHGEVIGRWAGRFNPELNIAFGFLLFGLSFLWWWRFLYVAMSRYLRLDRKNAIALFLCTQTIGLLVLAVILLSTLTESGPFLWFIARFL
jgi:hypothetical protein